MKYQPEVVLILFPNTIRMEILFNEEKKEDI